MAPPGPEKREERRQEESNGLLGPQHPPRFRDLTLLVIGQVSRVKFNFIPISD